MQPGWGAATPAGFALSVAGAFQGQATADADGWAEKKGKGGALTAGTWACVCVTVDRAAAADAPVLRAYVDGIPSAVSTNRELVDDGKFDMHRSFLLLGGEASQNAPSKTRQLKYVRMVSGKALSAEVRCKLFIPLLA